MNPEGLDFKGVKLRCGNAAQRPSVRADRRQAHSRQFREDAAFPEPFVHPQQHAAPGVALQVLDAQRAVAVLQAQGIRAVTRPVQPDTLELPPLPDEALAALVGALAGSGAGVVGLTSQTKNLEEIFLSLTKGDGEVA